MSVPKKLYLESTTRCNLRCSKCVKQMTGSNIKETDLPVQIFKQLLPSLRKVKTLILNGIGEPLLHPGLLEMIRLAREAMGDNGTIGFQSNGVLLNPERAAGVIDAGLNVLCLSLDSLQQKGRIDLTPNAPAVAATAAALQNLVNAAKEQGKPIRLGLEIVLSRTNLEELPSLVRWAAHNGVDFVLATHLFAYSQAMAEDSVFDPNTEPALDLYHKYQKIGRKKNIDLEGAIRSVLSSKNMVWDHPTATLFKQMRSEAAGAGIHLHFSNLLRYDGQEFNRRQRIFEDARESALTLGIDVHLPPLKAQHKRLCQFMEDEAAFINTTGEVMPCHFLWHTYFCMGGNDTIAVQEYSFGNIMDRSLDEIWESEIYREFRRQAVEDEYAACWSCPQSPCEDLVNPNMLGANDCYGSTVPCGHCRWSIGGLHCL